MCTLQCAQNCVIKTVLLDLFLVWQCSIFLTCFKIIEASYVFHFLTVESSSVPLWLTHDFSFFNKSLNFEKTLKKVSIIQ